MKSFLACVFSAFYLMFSSGAALQWHICGDEAIIISKTKDSCEICHSKTKKDCCKTVLKYIKVDKFQKAKSLDFKPLSLQNLLKEEQYFSFENFELVREENPSVLANAPPDFIKYSIFLRDCNFRI